MTRVLLLLLLVLPACQGQTTAEASTRYITLGADTLEITPRAHSVTTLTGYHGPESVLYDAESDAFYISNIVGLGSARDGDGYIVRLSAADYSQSAVFATGGLNAPKGMALRDEVLWVADIDILRGFDRSTGAPAGTVDLRPYGAVMLNDIAVGPGGALYVTDTGITMTIAGNTYVGGDRIFIVQPDNSVRAVASPIALPNGITWDERNRRWIVASFNPFGAGVYTLDEDLRDTTRIMTGPGRYDGVELLQDGRLLVTSWADQSVHMLEGGQQLYIAAGLVQPADLGFDSRRNRLLIPQVLLGHVAVFALSPAAAR